jgi:hypothetical protein
MKNVLIAEIDVELENIQKKTFFHVLKYQMDIFHIIIGKHN